MNPFNLNVEHRLRIDQDILLLSEVIRKNYLVGELAAHPVFPENSVVGQRFQLLQEIQISHPAVTNRLAYEQRQ